jgi:hypothetical protein
MVPEMETKEARLFDRAAVVWAALSSAVSLAALESAPALVAAALSRQALSDCLTASCLSSELKSQARRSAVFATEQTPALLCLTRRRGARELKSSLLN